MKEYTRMMKAEAQEDVRAIKTRNWSKWDNQTADERIQSIRDRRYYYREKWNRLWYSAETKAQKKYCDWVLENVNTFLGQDLENYAREMV